MNRYPCDIIDGREVPPLIINEDYDLIGNHDGSIHIEQGKLRILGKHNGSLHAHENTAVEIIGTQNGSTHIEEGAIVDVKGSINGSAHLTVGSRLIVNEGGKHSGSLHNLGKVIIRGVHGGSIHGNGDLTVEGNGRIVQPTIKNGNAYYEL